MRREVGVTFCYRVESFIYACTDATAEDSETQGRRPGPLYKLLETLKTGDKWPEWPRHRLRLNMKTSSPLCTQDSEARCPGGRKEEEEEGRRRRLVCSLVWNPVFNPVFTTKTEGSLLKPTLPFKSLSHRLISTLYCVYLCMKIRQCVLNKYGDISMFSDNHFQCLIKSE